MCVLPLGRTFEKSMAKIVATAPIKSDTFGWVYRSHEKIIHSVLLIIDN